MSSGNKSITIRVTPEQIKMIENWRDRQPLKPTIPAAISFFLSEGLKYNQEKEAEERAFKESLKPEGEEEPQRVTLHEPKSPNFEHKQP